LRFFSKRAASDLVDALRPQAIENDRLFHLAELVMEAKAGSADCAKLILNSFTGLAGTGMQRHQ
jgi:hypothetical protein